MAFTLHDVGHRCYRLTHRGLDIGAVFSTDDGSPEPWICLLHPGLAADPAGRPKPFTGPSHRFADLRSLKTWLGIRAPSLPTADAAAGAPA